MGHLQVCGCEGVQVQRHVDVKCTGVNRLVFSLYIVQCTLYIVEYSESCTVYNTVYLHGVHILLRQEVVQGPNVLAHLDEHAAVLLHKDRD